MDADKTLKLKPEKASQGANSWSATAQMLKGGIGSGLLFLPYAFSQCGTIFGCLLLIITALTCYFSWALLCKIFDYLEHIYFYDSLSIETTARILFSSKIELLLKLTITLFNFGTCVGYLVFIKKAVPIFEDQKYIIVLIVMGILLPLSMIPKIQNLNVLVQFSLLTLIISIISTIVISIISLAENKDTISTTFFDISNIPAVIGIFPFSFDVNGILTEVRGSMNKKYQFYYVLRRYLVVSCVLGIIVGLFGYLGFGAKTKENIFDNFSFVGDYQYALQIIFSTSLLASILLYCFTITQFFDEIVLSVAAPKTAIDLATPTSDSNPQELSKAKTIGLKILVRVILFALQAALSILVKDINEIFNLLGCVFCTILSYILPQLYLIKVHGYVKLRQNTNPVEHERETCLQDNKLPSSKHKCVDKLPQGKLIIFACVFTFVYGISGGISGIYGSINELIKK